MPLTVTIAALRGGFSFTTPFEPQDREVEWKDRRKVELEVEKSDTLGSALAQAIDQLGITRSDIATDDPLVDQLYWVAFHRGDDRTAVHATWEHTLTLVKEDGRLWWEQNFKEATFADLIRTSEAGMLKGDPLRPYLLLEQPGANGAFLGWAALLTGFAVLNFVLGALSNVEGAIALGERLLGRASAAKEAIDGEYLQLEERGAMPLLLAETLGEGPWHPDDLATKLDCSRERALGILQGYGFAEAESGIWRLEADDVAKFMRGVHDEIVYCYSDVPTETPEVALRERLEDYARTGERPEIPRDPRWPDIPDEPDVSRLSEDERIAWEAEHLMTEPGVSVGDGDDQDLRGVDLLDLEHMEVRCACGQDGCGARISFEKQDDKLRMKFENVEDHFTMRPAMLFAVLDQALPEELDAAGANENVD